MKKTILILGVVLGSSSIAISQTLWAPGGSVGSSSNSNVGIGTSSPSYKLDVRDAGRTVFNVGGPSSSTWAVGDIMIGTSNGVAVNNAKFWNFSFRTDTWSGNQGDFVLYSYNGSNFTSPFIAQSDGDIILVSGPNNSRLGDVAIGTTNPSGKLTIACDGGLTSAFGFGTNEDTYIRPGSGLGNVIMDFGKIGIGTTTPQDKLDVEGNMILGSSVNHSGADGEGGKLTFRRYSDGASPCTIKVISDQYGDNFEFYNEAGGGVFTWRNGRPENGGEVMRISEYGEVGIGTNNVAGYKLSVAGTMRAGQIEVTNPSTWSDFVFEDDYKLSPLNEVEAFIEENNHLPNVPSEIEIMNNGFDLAEMDAILLRKIEELTLYVIELEKKNETLRKSINNE